MKSFIYANKDPLPIIVHVVRRYGRVGGMETYVWNLTHGLVRSGINVAVVCEEVFGEPSGHIEICLAEKTHHKRRWRAMLGFRASVQIAIESHFRGREFIVHSHERSLNHQITTFHGPPIRAAASFSLVDRLNPRIRAWQRMELNEVSSDSVQMVLPVSHQIRKALAINYPGIAEKRVLVAWPGVDSNQNHSYGAASNEAQPPKFLFVGKEWKRKGLDLAIRLVTRYQRQIDAEAILDVYGPLESDLPRALRSSPIANFKGWRDEIPWEQYSALIHPARQEPFGMVVAEARQQGIPVLVSKQVGAAEVGFDGVVTIDFTESLDAQIENLKQMIHDPGLKCPEVKWSWDDLVELHLTEVYPSVGFGGLE